MKKRVFLVDTENLNNYSFIIKENLNKNDTIILCSTNFTQKIKDQDFEEIKNRNIKLERRRYESGSKNALDFGIIIELTMLCIRESNLEIFIVSEDTGYSSAVKVLKERFKEVKIEQIILKNKKRKVKKSSVKPENLAKEKKKVKKDSGYYRREILKEVRKINIKNADEYCDRIALIITDSKDKNEIHNNFVKAFGAIEGKGIYKKTKKYLLKFKELLN